MFKRGLTTAMSLLFMVFAFSTLADAQIEQVTLYLDAFLCGNECANDIQSALKVHTETIEDVKMDHKKHQVTLFPNPKKPLDLYDIRQDLQNAGRIPWKIGITVTGEVIDYTKTFPKAHLHPRKALKVKETGQQFNLIEGEQLDKLQDFVKAGHNLVTVSGEIPAFGEKQVALLVIQAFKEAKKEKETGSVTLAVEGFD